MTEDKEFKARVFKQLDHIEKKVDTLHRGLYGDPDNKQEGIIDRVKKHDSIIKVVAFFLDRPKWVIVPMAVITYLACYGSGRGLEHFILKLVTP